MTSKSLTPDDLADIVAFRRTDLNPATVKIAFQLLKDAAIEQIANGASVNFGLGYFSLGVNGVFIGDNAQWDTSQHSLSVNLAPTAELREAIKNTSVNVRGMAASGMAINAVTDVASGETNTKLTPGGGVNITGCKLKIDGDEASTGLHLHKQDGGAPITIPRTAILVNDPSKISFVMPADLPEGDYKLSISTQFSGTGKLLKEVRSFTFDYVLNIIY
ncbi:MAG: DUF4469 domain-containing protein [Bacteroidota bacterium]|nr:DUF4469 domain-containing protein [Bacteroidota bacterium]